MIESIISMELPAEEMDASGIYLRIRNQSERNASYSMRWNSMPFLLTERSFHHLPDMPVKNRNAAFCLKCHALIVRDQNDRVALIVQLMEEPHDLFPCF